MSHRTTHASYMLEHAAPDGRRRMRGAVGTRRACAVLASRLLRDSVGLSRREAHEFSIVAGKVAANRWVGHTSGHAFRAVPMNAAAVPTHTRHRQSPSRPL